VEGHPEQVEMLAKGAVGLVGAFLLLGPLVGVLGTALTVMGGAGSAAVSGLSFGLKNLPGTIGVASAAFLAFGGDSCTGVAKVIAIVGVLSGTLGTLGKLAKTHPLLAIASLVVTGVLLVIQYWDDIKEAVVVTGKAIRDIWLGLVDVLIGVFDSIVGGVRTVFRWLADLPGRIWDSIKGAFSAIVGWLGELWDTFVDAGAKLMTAVWEGMKSVFVDLRNWFVDAIKSLFSILPDGAIRTLHIQPMALPAQLGPQMPAPVEPGAAGQTIQNPFRTSEARMPERGLQVVPKVEVKLSALMPPQTQAPAKEGRPTLVIQNLHLQSEKPEEFVASLRKLEQEAA
jgi:hypothetical protein